MTCKWSKSDFDTLPYGDAWVKRYYHECEYEGDELYDNQDGSEALPMEDAIDKYNQCDECCPGYEGLPEKYDTDERV